MPIIRLPQMNRELEVQAGSVLMKALLKAGIPVASSCNGDGVCGKCKLSVESHAEGLSPKGELEVFLIQKFQLKPQQRISCQALVTGDIVITASYW